MATRSALIAHFHGETLSRNKVSEYGGKVRCFMVNPDVVRLRRMREAAAAALEMMAGRSFADLENNLMLSMAVTRCLEILGEAASKLSTELRQRFPELPYVQMVSMRNRLIHAYFDVDLNIVWGNDH